MSKFSTGISVAIEDRLLDVHTVLPGKVVQYYPADQLADVQIQVPLNGEKVPVLAKIPVAWPRTTDAFVHLPMAAGDQVLVLIPEETVGTWRANNAVYAPTGDLRRHSLSGAFCYPGGYPDGAKFTVTEPTKVTIKCAAGVRIEGDFNIQGALSVTGAITAGGEITAKAGTPAAVKVSTHTHPTGVGPSGPPTPGS